MIDDKKIEKAARQISEKVVDAKGFDDSNPRKGYYESLASLQRVMPESDYDDPMSGLYGEDEVEECFNDASSMSSFMY